MIHIHESQMNFGPFQNERCFHIERSEVYQRIQHGVQVSEFLLLKTRQGKPPVSQTLTLASCLKRHEKAKGKLPEHFQNLDLATTNFRFVLVIQGHPEAWLHPIKDALAKEFQAMAKTWALSANSVAVLNKEMAIEHGLVSPQ